MDFGAALQSHPVTVCSLSHLREEPCPHTPVLTAKIKLLWSCNLSCVFCRLPQSRALMSRDTALALGRELAAQGLRKVHFSGGEIMLHPDCFAILSDWSALGIQVNLTSNGTLMGKDEIRRLEEAGVHSVSLSIDSASCKIHDRLRGGKGAHRSVTRAAERIASRGKIRLRVNTVVTRRNIREMGSMREMLQRFGPNVPWKLIPVDAVDPRLLPRRRDVAALAAEAIGWNELEDREPFGTGDADFRATANGRHGFRETPCFAPWFHLFFTPEGDCHPCCMAQGTLPLGRYPDRSVNEILADKPMSALRSRMVEKRGLDVCAVCDDFLRESHAIVGLLAARKEA